MLSHCIIQGPLKKWTEHLLKLQLRVALGKPQEDPLGGFFWTLLIHVKIFLMWGQDVTVKVLLPYLKMSLYYHSTQINECSLSSFFLSSPRLFKLWNFQVQVNLFQKHLFLHQLTHNMTKDCSLNYKFSKWKLQAQTPSEHAQNMLCT